MDRAGRARRAGRRAEPITGRNHRRSQRRLCPHRLPLQRGGRRRRAHGQQHPGRELQVARIGQCRSALFQRRRLCRCRPPRSRRQGGTHGAVAEGPRQLDDGGRAAVRRPVAAVLDGRTAGAAAGGGRGTGEACSRGRAQGCASSELLAQQKQPPLLRVRVSQQPTFSRYVFELPELVPIVERAWQGRSAAGVRTSRSRFDLADAQAAPCRRRSNWSSRSEIPGRSRQSSRSRSSARWTCAPSARTIITSSTSRQPAGERTRPIRGQGRSRRSCPRAERAPVRPAIREQTAGRRPGDRAVAADDTDAEVSSACRSGQPAAAASAVAAKIEGQRPETMLEPAAPKPPVEPRPAARPSQTRRSRRQSRRKWQPLQPRKPPRQSRLSRPSEVADASSDRTAAKTRCAPSKWKCVGRATISRWSFPFAAPTPAAVFRRADTLWLVFDSLGADLDLGVLGRDTSRTVRSRGRHRSGAGQVVRFKLERPRLTSMSSEGLAWAVTIGDVVLDSDQAADADARSRRWPHQRRPRSSLFDDPQTAAPSQRSRSR